MNEKMEREKEQLIASLSGYFNQTFLEENIRLFQSRFCDDLDFIIFLSVEEEMPDGAITPVRYFYSRINKEDEKSDYGYLKDEHYKREPGDEYLSLMAVTKINVSLELFKKYKKWSKEIDKAFKPIFEHFNICMSTDIICSQFDDDELNIFGLPDLKYKQPGSKENKYVYVDISADLNDNKEE